MYATFNSMQLPALPKEVQEFCFKSYVYGRAFTKAFSITIAPRMITAGKTFLHYSYVGLQTLEQQELEAVQIQYNPVRAAAKAAWSELTSTEAIACYRQIQSVGQQQITDAKDRLMDVAIIGLCGVVAIAEGIYFAKAVYQKAVALYQKVSGFFSPTAPETTLLPTVEMAICTKSDAEVESIAQQLQQERQTIAQFDSAESAALNLVQALVDDEIVQVKIQQLKDARAVLVLAEESDRQAQAQFEFVVDKAIEFAEEDINLPNASRAYVPVVPEKIWNPEPTNMHDAVLEMAQHANPALSLDVPGAVREQRTRRRSSKTTTRKRSKKEAEK
jgi:hypothetical protein